MSKRVRNNHNTFLCIICLIIIALFAVKSLFHSGYFTSHDGWHQVVRLFYFDKSIRDGVIPPGYINYLFNGYGYPLFLFNYQFSWFLAEPFILLGFSIFDAIKIVYILSYVISGLTMYVWLKNKFSLKEAFIGSIIYLWAPYRFVNIFVRGAIGEACVFMFIPLLFLAADKIKNKNNIILGGLSLALIILSHAIVSFIIIVSFLIYGIFKAIKSSDIRQYLKSFFIIIIIGITLSAYYIIPAYSLKKYTKFNERFSLQYEGHFVSIKELIYSKWGYGFSTPRSFDSMSFQIGVGQWLIIITLVLAVAIRIIFRKKVNNYDYLIPFLIILIFSILLILPQSAFVWNFIAKNIFPFDFPWRLLTVIVFSISAITPYAISLLPKKIVNIFLIFLLFTVFYSNRNYLRVNQYTDIPIGLYLSSEKTTNTYDEYLPRQANQDEIEKEKKGGEIVTDKLVSITNLKRAVNRIEFNYEAETVLNFTIKLLYFPGYELFIDNNKSKVEITDWGLMKFTSNSGNHKVKVIYTGDNLTRFSQYISLLSFIGVISYLLFRRKNKRL